MKSKLFKLLKQAAQILLIVAAVGFGADWLRRPDVPADAAQMAVPAADGQTATLAQISAGNRRAVFLGKLVRHLQTHFARRAAAA